MTLTNASVAVRPCRRLFGPALEAGGKLARDSWRVFLGPAVPARRPRHSLAQALTVLKERVGRDHLVVQRASLALVAGVVQVDLTRLDVSETQIRGQFLDGFEVPGAVQFEHWKDEWRGGGGARGPGDLLWGEQGRGGG